MFFPLLLNELSSPLFGPGRSALSGGHTIARERADMMDVAWGLYARSASAVASCTHQPQGEGGNMVGREGKEGRDTNQTSHFPRWAHKYLCGWFINSRAREQIKVNCNAYIKPKLFHDTALHTMVVPIKYKATVYIMSHIGNITEWPVNLLETFLSCEPSF